MTMLGGWFEDLEALEAISQDDVARRICLRMAALSGNGRLEAFLEDVARDGDLDDETKQMVTELAAEPAFLLAVDDYLRTTHRIH